MNKFDKLYPKVTPIHEQVNSKYGHLIKGNEQSPCHHCKYMTYFVEISYEAPFCSDDCIYEFDVTLQTDTQKK